MEIKMKACCQIPGKAQVRNVFRKLWHMLRYAVNYMVSCREVQARRRIQIYLDGRLIDELTKTGKKIAKKDVKDRCNS